MDQTPPLHLDSLLPYLQGQLGTLSLIVFVALVPFAVMMMTSFTRLSVIFGFLKQALGLSEAPSNQILLALSLVLTAFIMEPVGKEIYKEAIEPYLKTKQEASLSKAWQPLRQFMLKQTRPDDLELFLNISRLEKPSPDDIPWYCIIPSFVISELRYAFILGFLLLLPFLVIDMVIASVLTSLGVISIPPTAIALPLKLLLFILVDGWHLVINQMIEGYA